MGASLKLVVEAATVEKSVCLSKHVNITKSDVTLKILNHPKRR